MASQLDCDSLLLMLSLNGAITTHFAHRDMV
jgi:hypothetical protein